MLILGHQRQPREVFEGSDIAGLHADGFEFGAIELGVGEVVGDLLLQPCELQTTHALARHEFNSFVPEPGVRIGRHQTITFRSSFVAVKSTSSVAASMTTP